MRHHRAGLLSGLQPPILCMLDVSCGKAGASKTGTDRAFLIPLFLHVIVPLTWSHGTRRGPAYLSAATSRPIEGGGSMRRAGLSLLAVGAMLGFSSCSNDGITTPSTRTRPEAAASTMSA